MAARASLLHAICRAFQTYAACRRPSPAIYTTIEQSSTSVRLLHRIQRRCLLLTGWSIGGMHSWPCGRTSLAASSSVLPSFTRPDLQRCLRYLVTVAGRVDVFQQALVPAWMHNSGPLCTTRMKGQNMLPHQVVCRYTPQHSPASCSVPFRTILRFTRYTSRRPVGDFRLS